MATQTPYPAPSRALRPAPEAGPDYLSLPDTVVLFHGGNQTLLITGSSLVLFARLHACAVDREHIVSFIQGGRELGTQSLAALNCYLRSWRIGRGGLPWKSSTRNRHDWRAFVAHLELVFR